MILSMLVYMILHAPSLLVLLDLYAHNNCVDVATYIVHMIYGVLLFYRS